MSDRTAPDAQPPAEPELFWSRNQNAVYRSYSYDKVIVRAAWSRLAETVSALPADAVRLVPAASGLPVWTVCPTCSSSRPHLHPTADLCPDPFHRPEPATAGEWRAEVPRCADLLDQIGQLPAGTGLDAVARIVADMRREVSVPVAALAGTTTPTDDEVRAEAARRLRAMAKHHSGTLALDLLGIADWLAYAQNVDDARVRDRALASARALLASTPTAEETTP